MSTIENQIKAISKELNRLNDSAPEMTGLDFAYERGNISAEEHSSAEEQSNRILILEKQQADKIEQLRKKDPELFKSFHNNLMGKLNSAFAGLKRAKQIRVKKSSSTKNKIRFNLTILPDIISTLDNWHSNSDTKHSFSWAFRIVFDTLQETNKLIDKIHK